MLDLPRGRVPAASALFQSGILERIFSDIFPCALPWLANWPSSLICSLASSVEMLRPLTERLIFPHVLCVDTTALGKELVSSGLLKQLCTVLRDSRQEKVVRVSINALMNVLKDDDAVELIIEENTLQVLTLLEYEKWRDKEMYDAIRHGLGHLNTKIALFSNFDRYALELSKQKLKWSFLHSEKFWHQNVMAFQDNEFQPIKTLSQLLSSTDSVTVCVACHDLGEFARLHPTGKTICQRLQVKESVMNLMQSKDCDIAREALLCCQKLMLQRWQDVGK
eukprot:Platyproteum_vivax@DN16205_c0_g1_i1.p1